MRYLPQEIELWYVIPALRRAFALEMARRGMRGVEIAQFLGLTKAAVSQYMKKIRAVEFPVDVKMQDEIKFSVDRIRDGEKVAAELQRMINLLRDNKSICQFHHRKEHIGSCDICFRY